MADPFRYGEPRAGGWVRFAKLALVFFVLVLFPLRGIAQTYKLQPGDQLRLSILELPVPAITSQIGMDGRALFPYLGEFLAQGSTLEGLQAEISLAAAGKLVTVHSPSGERLQIALDGSGVFLSIASFRSVYMAGDVARRGPIEYVPGMTVRTALATAGGASEIPLMFEQALLQAPDMQSRFETLASDHARAVVQLWGIEAILVGDAERPAPVAGDTAVPPELLAEYVVAEQQSVAFRLEEFDRQEKYMNQQLDTLTAQIERFEEQLQNQEEMLELQQEQVSQVESLVDSGLAVTSRLNGAHQSLLTVSSNALAAQSAMVSLTLRREELEQQLDAQASKREGAVRADRAALIPQIQTLESQLQAARLSLAMNGIVVDSTPQEPSTAFTLARAEGEGDVTTRTVTLDTPLWPGDVVEVSVDYPVAGTIQANTAAK